ncbi:MAG: ABC-2 family transporter protein [Bdellovibrionaceae bacterium]|nr:ABC-2 family transporter protein [Bdellovibrionales bacterium]MCB9086240.1 ABC-2 family transporter protein [Pseudobdellovibrionaceae bacterium]
MSVEITTADVYRRSWSWIGAVLSMELRKIFSYRVDFWLQVVGGFFSQFVVAYYLWQAIFEHNQAEKIGGYSFPMMVAYYVLAPFVDRIVRANNAFVISQEIYEGSLSRYLIYPVNYLGFRFVSTLAHALVGLAQMVVGVGVILLIWGYPPELTIGWSGLAMGIASCLVSIFVYYLMASIIEMVAFWADNVWSLLVMLQFSSAFLGGGLIPLEVFPVWVQTSLLFTPFPYLIGYPIQGFMGRLSSEQWAEGLLIILLWTIPLMFTLRWIWERGRKTYTGVGI